MNNICADLEASRILILGRNLDTISQLSGFSKEDILKFETHDYTSEASIKYQKYVTDTCVKFDQYITDKHTK